MAPEPGIQEYRKLTRTQILEIEREADPDAAERVRAEVQAFISDFSKNVAKYMITLRKDGRPHARPVSTFVEGWTVGTISQGEHLKNQHIRNNPVVAYLWVEQFPKSVWPKSVFMQGTCRIEDDQEVVKAFFARRKARTGQGDGHPEEEWTRLLLVTTPTIVRAEGFLEPNKPAVYRDFSR